MSLTFILHFGLCLGVLSFFIQVLQTICQVKAEEELRIAHAAACAVLKEQLASHKTSSSSMCQEVCTTMCSTLHVVVPCMMTLIWLIL